MIVKYTGHVIDWFVAGYDDHPHDLWHMGEQIYAILMGWA